MNQRTLAKLVNQEIRDPALCLNCSIVYKDLRKVETDGVICATFVNVFDNVFNVKKEVCGADSVSKKSVCL